MRNVIEPKNKPGINTAFLNKDYFTKKKRTVQQINRTFDLINTKIKDINAKFIEQRKAHKYLGKQNCMHRKASQGAKRAFVEDSLWATKDITSGKPFQTNINQFDCTRKSKNNILADNSNISQRLNRQGSINLTRHLNLSQNFQAQTFQNSSNYQRFTGFEKSIQDKNIERRIIGAITRKNFALSLEKSKQKDEGLATNDQSMERFISSSTPNQFSRLLLHLNEQIIIDQAFLTIKQWFNYYGGKTKWSQLTQQLRKVGLQLGQLAIKSIFSINSEDQCSFSLINQYYSISDLVAAYIASQSNWSRTISHKFDTFQLYQQNFNEQALDIRRKGHISIQDLVYFINSNLETEYSNRDLTLIYRRLKKFKYLHFSDIVQAIHIENTR